MHAQLAPAEPANSTLGGGTLARTVLLLGGTAVLGSVDGLLSAHRVIANGLPARALIGMAESVQLLDEDALLGPIGVSARTLQRRRTEPDSQLSPEQSGRTWKLAEILARATELFGNQTEAERWLQSPAIALDQHTPLELLRSPAGVELVETLLSRMEYGVYT